MKLNKAKNNIPLSIQYGNVKIKRGYFKKLLSLLSLLYD